MSNIVYNDTVDNAYKESLQDNLLDVPKHYLIAKHGIRHTIVIHLIDYMECRGLKPSTDFLAATYLASEDYAIEPTHSIKIQDYMQMILILRQHDEQLTLEMFDVLTDDEIVYMLIHLWVDLLFLDYYSNNKETKNFIRNYISYTELVLKALTNGHDQIQNSEAFDTIATVLFTEIDIVRAHRLDEGRLYDGM